MNSFITTILVLLLLYFGLKLIFRWARPFILRYLAKKMAEKFGQGPSPFDSYQQQSEGEVSIDKKGIPIHCILLPIIFYNFPSYLIHLL